MLAGVDIGGTFTDFVLAEDGQIRIHKVLSTPKDPAQAMLLGLRALVPNELDSLQRLSHGSTVATNAILERKGARCALITTEGFRDLLVIGRQNRPDLYELQPTMSPPVIPRDRCYDIPERLDATGQVLLPLDTAALDAVLDEIEQSKVESVAVCFLYGYLNPAHEQAVRDRIVERGLLEPCQVALSSDVLPEFREYERASTVAMEAYVRPVVSRYLQRLEEKLPPTCGLTVMTSDGGVIGAKRAREQAVHTALSGPAAGAIGGFQVAQCAGYEQVITLDMGGTSTDVALCPGELVQRAESEIDGLPLRTRMLDVETIGAGGGSIARLDAGGLLRVGPDSAGADPGPIAYGLGGEDVTVTDANVLLGRVDPDHFLGGDMRLKPGPVRTAIERLSNRMRASVEEAALGIIRVANANIDRALRRVSIARGHDPRRFTLVAFGGAGPLHACAVAQQLDIPRVLVPRYSGVLCALGLLMADAVLERSYSVLEVVTPETVSGLRQRLADMAADARSALTAEGFQEEIIILQQLVDARYSGQSYELTIPFETDLAAAFHAAHAAAYGHSMRGRTVEVVNVRIRATGLVDGPAFKPEPLVKDDGVDAYLGKKPGFTERHGVVQVARYARERLRPGAVVPGPALIFQMDSTTYVSSDWVAHVDGYRNVVMERA